MKSLLEYMKHRNGTYVSLDLSTESKVQLDNYLSMTLDPMDRVDPDSYHTTIIYSRTPVPDAEQYAGYLNTSSNMYRPAAKPVKYEVFPTKNDGKCLVLRLFFPLAEELNDILTLNHGATSDYSEYKPHLTIAYNMQEDINPDDLPVPPFELLYDKVTVAPLETDYVPPNKESK